MTTVKRKSAGASGDASPGYAQVWAIAWPIMLANCTVPLLGLADTAVIGHTGQSHDLGAIALGSLVFSFLYWSFGFLRMGTTGFTAQADGAGDAAEVRAILGRALLIAAAIGLGLIALQVPLAALALSLLGASADVEALTGEYVRIRVWGAPASLALYALMGAMIGTGNSGRLLRVQLLLNGLNVALDVLFAGVLGLGVAGIALGTVIAEWVALVFALMLMCRLLSAHRNDGEAFWPRARIADRRKLRQTLSANADIMVRTLALLFGFAWFTDQSARFGDTLLAGNHILLQFIAFSAFFLDGIAFATEALVGRAAGAVRVEAFDRAVRVSSVMAAVVAAALSALLWALGPLAIAALTDLADVRAAAGRYLPYAAMYVLLAVAAFQLDGVFVGATRGRAMRNAALLALAVFLAAWWGLVGWAGNDGLWLAFIVFALARALALGAYYPGLRRSLALSAER